MLEVQRTRPGQQTVTVPQTLYGQHQESRRKRAGQKGLGLGAAPTGLSQLGLAPVGLARYSLPTKIDLPPNKIHLGEHRVCFWGRGGNLRNFMTLGLPYQTPSRGPVQTCLVQNVPWTQVEVSGCQAKPCQRSKQLVVL